MFLRTHPSSIVLRLQLMVVILSLPIISGCDGTHERGHDTIGFEFAVVEETPAEGLTTALATQLQDRLHRLPLQPDMFDGVRVSAVDERTIRIAIQKRGFDESAIEEQLRNMLTQTPRSLEFRILAQPDPEKPAQYDRFRKQLQESGPQRSADDELGWFKISNPSAFLYLKNPGALSGFNPRTARNVVEKRGDDFYVLAKLSSDDGILASQKDWQVCDARVARDTMDRRCIHAQLDERGGELLAELTQRNRGQTLCILIDNEAMSNAIICNVVRAHILITGVFSEEEASDLVRSLSRQVGPRLKFVGTTE